MIAQTYSGLLPCGLPVEIKRFKTYHQDWLTETPSKNKTGKTPKENKSLEHVIADCVVQIGDTDFRNLKLEEKVEVIQKLPSTEFKYLTLMVRFFTCDIDFTKRMDAYHEWCENNQGVDEGYVDPIEPHEFKFNLDYEEDGVSKTKEYSINLALFDFDVKLGVIRGISTIDEIKQHLEQSLELPISGLNITWEILDLEKELKYQASTSQPGFSINSPLVWRGVKRYIKSDKPGDENKQGVRVTMNKGDIGSLEVLDSSALRKDVMTKEGYVNTVISVEDPNPKSEKLIDVDVINVTSFFIPSGVM